MSDRRERTQARLAICRACPHRIATALPMGRKTVTLERCSLCGCPLALRIQFRGAACPAGKW